VGLVDRRAADEAGARWVNGVPSRVFAEVGLSSPLPPELLAQGHRFTVAPATGRHRHAIDGHDVLEVDMRRLGARLRTDAERTGVHVQFGAPVEHVEVERGRPVALRAAGRRWSAPLFVDASGLPAVVRRAVFPGWPAMAREHLCLAAQEVRVIDDRAGAAAFLRRHRLGAGEVYARTGGYGGFSLLNVRVDLDEGHVAILTGAIASGGDALNGAGILARFVDEERWIGARIFGGAAAIPLHRPYARLVAPGLALLGDAGSMIYPAHASGIAIGLRAARMLADVVADARSRLDAPETTWRFAHRFHTRYGGVLAGYDVFRRLSQSFSPEESEAVLGSGLLGTSTLAAGLVQELPAPAWTELLRAGQAAVRHPRLAAKLGAALARIPPLLAHALLYPRTPDVAALARWEARTAALVGEAPMPVA
jgi:flavin-dependent dehydrogenase